MKDALLIQGDPDLLFPGAFRNEHYKRKTQFRPVDGRRIRHCVRHLSNWIVVHHRTCGTSSALLVGHRWPDVFNDYRLRLSYPRHSRSFEGHRRRPIHIHYQLRDHVAASTVALPG